MVSDGKERRIYPTFHHHRHWQLCLQGMQYRNLRPTRQLEGNRTRSVYGQSSERSEIASQPPADSDQYLPRMHATEGGENRQEDGTHLRLCLRPLSPHRPLRRGQVSTGLQPKRLRNPWNEFSQHMQGTCANRKS